MGCGSSTTRYMTSNGTTIGNDHINTETLKAGDDTISKTLVAKLYTKCLSERRIPTVWKNAKTVIIFKKGNKKDLMDYRPIHLLSNIYKVLTTVPKRPEKTLDENQPREQAGFRTRYSTTDHIVIYTKVVYVNDASYIH